MDITELKTTITENKLTDRTQVSSGKDKVGRVAKPKSVTDST